jgi:hypothetical protein
VVVTGRLTIPTADGDLLHYSAVASEPLESASKAPAAEVAASSCLRRPQRWRVWVWSCGDDEVTINIDWQDQFGRWHHYQTKQNQADAYRVAQRRAESTGKRHRLVDGDGRLLDVI